MKLLPLKPKQYFTGILMGVFSGVILVIGFFYFFTLGYSGNGLEEFGVQSGARFYRDRFGKELTVNGFVYYRDESGIGKVGVVTGLNGNEVKLNAGTPLEKTISLDAVINPLKKFK